MAGCGRGSQWVRRSGRGWCKERSLPLSRPASTVSLLPSGVFTLRPGRAGGRRHLPDICVAAPGRYSGYPAILLNLIIGPGPRRALRTAHRAAAPPGESHAQGCASGACHHYRPVHGTGRVYGIIWGYNPLQVPWRGPTRVLTFLGIRALPLEIILVSGAIVVAVGLFAVFRFTSIGQACLAISQDREAAMLRGINVEALSIAAFAGAGGLAAIAAVAIGPETFAIPNPGPNSLAPRRLRGTGNRRRGQLQSAHWSEGSWQGIVSSLAVRYISADYANLSVLVPAAADAEPAPEGTRQASGGPHCLTSVAEIRPDREARRADNRAPGGGNSRNSLQGRRALVIPPGRPAALLLYPVLSGNNAYWINQISQIAILALIVSRGEPELRVGRRGPVQPGVHVRAGRLHRRNHLGPRFHGDRPPAALGGLAAMLAGIIVAFRPCGSAAGRWRWRRSSWSSQRPTSCRSWPVDRRGQRADRDPVTRPGRPLPRRHRPLRGHHRRGILWFACYRNLVTSRYGTLFRILRESPVQAASLGFAPSRLKLLAYALGALPAGMAGVLFVFVSEFIQPSSVDLTLAIGVVAASVLGGTESIYGAVVGAAILQLGPRARSASRPSRRWSTACSWW